MDRGKTMAKDDRVEDFEPTVDWMHNDEHDTRLVYLPGFRRDQIKVQVTSDRKLRVMGERSLKDGNINRFHKEIPIPLEYSTDQISAKFEQGVLQIKHPKTSKPKNQRPTTETARPQEPAKLLNQKDDQGKPNKEAPQQKVAEQKKPETDDVKDSAVPEKTAKNDQKDGKRQANEEAPQQKKIAEKSKRETNEITKANGTPGETRKETEVPSDSKEKNTESAIGNAHIQQKTSEDKKDHRPDQEAKVTEASKEPENLGQHVHKAEKMDKEATATVSGKSKFDYHKQVFERLAAETMQRIKSTQCIVVTMALLSLGLGIYVKYALRSPEESEN